MAVLLNHEVVCALQSRIPWDPQCMQRALNDKRSSTRGGEQEEDEDGMLVVDCSDGHVELAGVSTYDFFNAYKHVHTLEQVGPRSLCCWATG